MNGWYTQSFDGLSEWPKRHRHNTFNDPRSKYSNGKKWQWLLVWFWYFYHVANIRPFPFFYVRFIVLILERNRFHSANVMKCFTLDIMNQNKYYVYELWIMNFWNELLSSSGQHEMFHSYSFSRSLKSYPTCMLYVLKKGFINSWSVNLRH